VSALQWIGWAAIVASGVIATFRDISLRGQLAEERGRHFRELASKLDRIESAERARCLAIARYHGARVVAEGIEAGRIAGERPRRKRGAVVALSQGMQLSPGDRLTVPDDDDRTESKRYELAEFEIIHPKDAAQVNEFLDSYAPVRRDEMRPPAGDMATHIDDDPTPEPAA
jgi:hypothetical protein